MKGKRQALATIMKRSGLTTLLNRLAPRSLTILGYHRILHRENIGQDGLDTRLCTPDAETFRRQLIWLKNHTNLVTQEDLLRFFDRGEPLPKRAVMVTFDDGYIDNFTVAATILNEVGIQALFFVTTSMISAGHLGWWEHVSHAIRNCKLRNISIRERSFSLPEEAELAIAYCNQMFKLKPHDQTRSLMEEIYDSTQSTMISPEQSRSATMTWEDVRKLRKMGHEIGGHTVSHRVLATLTSDDQAVELQSSKEEIERELGEPIKSVAYPVGSHPHYNSDTLRLTQQAGYQLGFTFETGLYRGSPEARFELRRVMTPPTLELLQSLVVTQGLL